MKAPYMHLYAISTLLAVGAAVWKYLNPAVPTLLIAYPIGAMLYAMMNQLIVALCRKNNKPERFIRNVLWIEFAVTVIVAVVVGFWVHWLACYMVITLPLIDWAYRYGYQWIVEKSKEQGKK